MRDLTKNLEFYAKYVTWKIMKDPKCVVYDICSHLAKASPSTITLDLIPCLCLLFQPWRGHCPRGKVPSRCLQLQHRSQSTGDSKPIVIIHSKTTGTINKQGFADVPSAHLLLWPQPRSFPLFPRFRILHFASSNTRLVQASNWRPISAARCYTEKDGVNLI